jgi:hypothetical protein
MNILITFANDLLLHTYCCCKINYYTYSMASYCILVWNEKLE